VAGGGRSLSGRRDHPQYRRRDRRGDRLGAFVEVITLGNVAPSLEKWLPVGASIGLTNPPGPVC
jgi:hypothetical protein